MKEKKNLLNLRKTLIVFAILPMVISALVLSIVLVLVSSDELKRLSKNSLVSIVEEIGSSFDYTAENNERSMETFLKAPIVTEFLKNPDDPVLAAKAQKYTVDYYNKLDGWEGIYIADWNSKVLTHPAEAVVGRVMREGERLEQLRNAMLSSDGVYNVGIITSPASGLLTISMYAPVYDENNNPIGYVGGGTFVQNVASNISDVSSLQFDSAYVYFTDAVGTMLYHPDESKIGSPVENAAVLDLVDRLGKGEDLDSGVVSYEYKGKTKYAGYYVGFDNSYIAIVTVDESNVLKNINLIVVVAVILVIFNILVVVGFTIFMANLIAKPLGAVADSIEELGTGNVTANCEAKSKIDETVRVINAFHTLKNALMDSISNVKQSEQILNESIINVDEMTTHNVESINQINKAIDEVAATSQTVAEKSQDMTIKSAELGDSVEELNKNVVLLTDESAQIKKANEDATKCMNSVYAGANESVDAMSSITEKISETNVAVTDIQSAIQAIEEIADQTNLLSLNASIEAARAGESGKGFAVVADEIRTLADSSAKTANDIKKIIENIMTLSNETVDISARVSEVIEKEQNDIKTAQEKFTTLSDSVEASIMQINTIKNMTDKLDEIKGDLVSTTTELGAVSQELGATAQEVAANCQIVSEGCVNTQESTEQMRHINEEMSQSLEYFKVE